MVLPLTAWYAASVADALLIAIPCLCLLAWLAWLEVRLRRQKAEAAAEAGRVAEAAATEIMKGYQVANMHRFNHIMVHLRAMEHDKGWGDSLALTQDLDPDELGRMRRETGPT